MSASSSDKTIERLVRKRWWLAVALPLWVLVGFGLSQALLVAAIFLLRTVGVPFEAINQAALNAILAAAVYTLSLAIVIGVPWLVRRRRVTKQEIGLTRLPSWLDIGLAPAGLVVYLLISALLVYITSLLVPGIDLEQAQEVGFSNLSSQFEYIIAFVTLIVIAPLAEEVLFRGYLYGKLRKFIPAWLTAFIVSALFGLVHGQWNVAIDVFALSLVLCALREITGNIWAGVLLHMLKNGIAFYFLFIYPTLV